MIPLAVPNLTGRESEYLQACIETTFVSSVGPFITRFEKMVAEAAGDSLAVATSTGMHHSLTNTEHQLQSCVRVDEEPVDCGYDVRAHHHMLHASTHHCNKTHRK